MSFTTAWLIPRVGFWLLWTVWLFLARQWEITGAALFLPPLAVVAIGSRWAPNPLDTPNALLCKGAAASCLIAGFVDVLSLQPGTPIFLLVPVGLISIAILTLRGFGNRRVQVTGGDLFQAVGRIASHAGIKQPRLIVFSSPRPAAFAARSGAVLLSEPLLHLLSRRETEAVMAHEVSHLRPANFRAMVALPLVPAAIVVLNGFSGGALWCAPLIPAAAALLWTFLRRRQEFEADAAAVANTGDAEALITALTRIASASGLPLEWNPLAALCIGHPPILARFRRIARQANIAQERLRAIIASAGACNEEGYASPLVREDSAGLYQEYARRVGLQLLAWQIAEPAAAGIAAGAVAILYQPPFVSLLVVAIAAGMAIRVAGHDLISGIERQRLRNRLGIPPRDARFAALALAEEPRLYDGGYHYDLGFVSTAANLEFQGSRCAFAISPAQVRRIWLAPGPRHFLPRYVVCVEYVDREGSAVISLQPLDRWFWPATTNAATRLLSSLQQWAGHHGDFPAPADSPPRVQGTAVDPLPTAMVWKSVYYSASVALAAAWVFQLSVLRDPSALYQAFIAPVVAGALALFGFLPHLRLTRAASPHNGAPSQAAPEPE
ncbi:MAG: M48 family metalloprotease [Bryobacteraceae bacterium]